MKHYTTSAWNEYEVGKDYKRRIGLYETVRRNERFYRGDQWHGVTSDLPHPVFNLVRRITDYLICSVLPGDISITYNDERLPFVESSAVRARIREGLRVLDQNASYRWNRSNVQAIVHKALLNAAISGDGVFYCWWDASQKDGQAFMGDIGISLIDNTDLFVADVNNTDLQSQRYLILAGRASVSELQQEAIDHGMNPADAKRIVSDQVSDALAGDLAAYELQGDEKATYLIRFSKENGEVVFEKSTRNCVICRVKTGLSLYPVAYFNWHPVKNSFHGSAPVSDMIANQKYINTAYAMVMKHMYDTAFSKVIYDKSRIPEWSNEVGEAIAAVGGGNVCDAVSVVGVGQMQEGYLDLINNVIENTKDLMGATEAALGDASAHNTSALLVLQEASKLALRQVSTDFCRCIGDMASIWADMLCTYCPPERLLVVSAGDQAEAKSLDYQLLKNELLRATIKIGHVNSYTPAATVSLLDKLLDEGYLDVKSYLSLLPSGTVTDLDKIMTKIKMKGVVKDE